MDSARLPAHLEVTGLLRAVEAAGGFAAVLAKGERDGGTLLVICCVKGTDSCVYERMPQLDGSRKWTVTHREVAENTVKIGEYWKRRKNHDPDLWVLELDHPEAAQFLNG